MRRRPISTTKFGVREAAARRPWIARRRPMMRRRLEDFDRITGFGESTGLSTRTAILSVRDNPVILSKNPQAVRLPVHRFDRVERRLYVRVGGELSIEDRADDARAVDHV